MAVLVVAGEAGWTAADKSLVSLYPELETPALGGGAGGACGVIAYRVLEAGRVESPTEEG